MLIVPQFRYTRKGLSALDFGRTRVLAGAALFFLGVSGCRRRPFVPHVVGVDVVQMIGEPFPGPVTFDLGGFVSVCGPLPGRGDVALCTTTQVKEL